MPYIGNSHVAGDHTNNFKVLDDISSFTATFDGSASSVVDTTNNTIRVVEHRFIQGQRVTYTNGGGGNIGGLTTGTAYFVIFDSASTIKLATTASNAASSTAINLSTVGTGSSHTLNAAFDGVNKRFKITYDGGTSARLNNATQLNVAINNVLQKPNNDAGSFSDGFAILDNHKIVFQTAPVSGDIFWGSIIANTLTTFDISDHKIDTFTGDGSTTEFTLSHTPANNESLMVTINGVLQHPSNASTARAYTLIASIIQFTAAPANGDEIQVRHLGFAGATSADVSGFYGRTGNVVLTDQDDITVNKINVGTGVTIESNGQATFVGVVTFGSGSTSIDNNVVNVGTALTLGHTQGLQFHTQNLHSTGFEVNNINASGIITASQFVGNIGGNPTFSGDTTFTGNVSIGGTLTYEDVTNIDSVGIITARDGIDCNGDLDVDGHTNLDNVSIAGVTTVTGSNINIEGGSANNSQLKINSTGRYRGVQLDENGTRKAHFQHDATSNKTVVGTAEGTMQFNSGDTPRVVLNSSGHWVPYVDGTYDLGINGTRWRNVYADTLYGDGQNITGTTIRSNLTWDGTTLLANKASGVGYIASKGGTSGGDYGIVQVQSGSTVRGRLVADAAVDAFRLDSAGRANAPITFHTGSSYTERLRIKSDGNVTIGNAGDSGSNPSAGYDELCIEGGNEDIGMCFLSPAANNVTHQISFGDSNNNQAGRIIYNHASDYMALHANSDERLRINSTGKVGIGQTSNIQTRLHVSENLAESTAINWQNSTMSLTSKVGGNSTNNRSTLYFAPYNAANQYCPSAISCTAGGTYESTLKFFTNGHGNGTGHLGAYERLRITTTGKVGINSTTPSAKLEIADAAQTNLLTLKRTSGNSGIFSVQIGGSDPGVLFTTSGISDDFVFRPGGNDRVRITSAGDINIHNRTAVSSTDPVTVDFGGQYTPDASITHQNLKVKLFSNSSNNDAAGLTMAQSGNAYVSSVGAGHLFYTAPSAVDTLIERLRITHDGKLEVKGTRAGALQANDDDALKLFTKSTSADINRGVGITFYTHDGSGYEMGGTIQVAKENGNLNSPKSYMRFSTQDGSTTSEKLRITSDGKVGIGLYSNLIYALEVKYNGTNLIRINNAGETGHGSHDAYIIAGGNYFQNPVIGGSIIKFNTYNGSTFDERVRITSTGQIGVGVNAPTFAAINSISANAARGIEIFQDGTDTGSAIKLAGDNGSGNKAYSQLGYSGADATTHWANYNTSGTKVGEISIASNGDVKVTSRGSNESGAPFYVAVTGKSSITYGGGNDDTACVRIEDNGTNDNYYHGIELRAKRSGDARIYVQDKGSDQCDLVFATDNSGLTEKLRITSTGIVKITGDSSGQLNLRRSTSTNQEAIFYYGSSSLEIETREATNIFLKTNQHPRVKIQANGRITMGEANFDASNDLHLKKANSGGDVAMRITNNSGTNSGTTASLYFTTSPTQDFNTSYIQAVRDGGKLNFGYSTNSPTLTMQVSTGKVGIGTENPTTALEVKGDITISNANNQADIFFGEHGDVADSKALIRMDQLSSTDGELQFHTESGGTLAERLRISSKGNVVFKDKDSGHRGGGIYSRTKTVNNTGDSTTGFMKFTLTHGALAGMIILTGSNSGASVAKTYAFVAQYGQTVTTNLLADTGAYGGYNFSFTSSTTNNQHNFMVQVSGGAQEVNMTVIMGCANQNISYTEL